MKTSIAAALAGLAMASTPTLGADLFGTAPPPMAYPADQQAEVGSNWYLRGDLGLDLDQAPSFSMAGISQPTGPGFLPYSTSLGSPRPHEDFSADIGVGYRYNNWLRFEGTYEYRTAASGKNRNSVLCPDTTTPVGTSGYLYDVTGANTPVCTGALNLNRRDSTALAAAYLDLGNYWGVTPYVGAGVGLNADMISGRVNYTVDSTGAAQSFTPSLTPGVTNQWVDAGGTPVSPQPNIPLVGGSETWSHSIHATHYSMAWALMGGFGIQLSPSFTLDVGYRYLNAGTSTLSINPQTGSTVKLSNTSQDIRVGIRLMAN